MKVVIGGDHAGLSLKSDLARLLVEWGHEVDDVGTHTPDSVDYPDFAVAVARKVVESRGESLGVLVCGSGVGVCIAANKVAGIRAARCDEAYTATMARAHNDANVLCLGARVIGVGLAEQALRAFLTTPFAGGRHQLRVDKLSALDD